MFRKAFVLVCAIGIGVVVISVLSTRDPDLLNTVDGCTVQKTPVLTLEGPEVERGLLAMTDQHVFLAVRSELRAFDSSGRYVRVAAREGNGPGEIQLVMGLAAMPDGRIAVVDSESRLTFSGPESSAGQTVRIPVSAELAGIIAMPDGSVVVAGDMHSDTAPGSPLAQVGPTGRLMRYFGGNETETEEPARGMLLPRLVAFHPDVGLVSVKRYKYHVEYWDSVGNFRDRWERPAPWFVWPPVFERDAAGRHEMTMPEEKVVAVQLDEDGYLWVLIHDGESDWQEAVQGGRITDPHKWVDTRVDVMDPTSRTVLCSAVMDEAVEVSFAGEGIISTYHEDRSGQPSLKLWRLSYSRP